MLFKLNHIQMSSEALTTSFTLEQIQTEIKNAHNPGLVLPEESPNGNWITHLYSYGEITSQKGGWAYLQRSEFTFSYDRFKKNYSDLFPMKRDNNTYAIMTDEDAKRIKKMILDYETQLVQTA